MEIESVKFETKAELLTRERFHIEGLRAELNARIPLQTDHEYYLSHREKIKANVANYKANNLEKVNAYNKQYADDNNDIVLEKKSAYNAKVRPRTTKRNSAMWLWRNSYSREQSRPLQITKTPVRHADPRFHPFISFKASYIFCDFPLKL